MSLRHIDFHNFRVDLVTLLYGTFIHVDTVVFSACDLLLSVARLSDFFPALERVEFVEWNLFLAIEVSDVTMEHAITRAIAANGINISIQN